MDQQQQQIYELYRRQHHDQVKRALPGPQSTTNLLTQMAFTPLVSPAVTPLDTHVQFPDYVAPSEPFSPLTSPALHVRTNVVQPASYAPVRGSDTSDTTSPIDANTVPNSSPAVKALRKSRRKASTSSMKPNTRAIRQSPAMKPRSRRKQPSSTSIPSKEVVGIIEEARKSQHPASVSAAPDARLPVSYTQDSSGADSVSPESLSEILMPPPATPRSNSAGKSPHLQAMNGGTQAHVDLTGEPATPASLMRLRKQAEKAKSDNREALHLEAETKRAEMEMERIMGDIRLPGPSADHGKSPLPRPINTAQASAHAVTSAVSAQGTPRNGPVSEPVTATGSAFPSPSGSAIASPNGSIAGKRSDHKSKSSDPKKRGNSNSEKASPALRPRISPSIKPLLPDGGKMPHPFFCKLNSMAC